MFVFAGQRPVMVQDWKGGSCQLEESAAGVGRGVLLLLMSKDERVAPEACSNSESWLACKARRLPDLT